MPMASMLQNMIRLGVLPGKDAAYAHKIIFEDKPKPHAMFATTDLRTIQRPYLDGDPKDVEHEGQIYRKVDLLFWAWLWTRLRRYRNSWPASPWLFRWPWPVCLCIPSANWWDIPPFK